MIKKVEPSNLLKQASALGSYLDELLHDATHIASKPVEQVVEIEPVDRAACVFENLAFKNDLSVKPEPINQCNSSIGLTLDQFPVQCLMFKVGDNLLSLPLAHLSGVVPWPDDLSILPQSPDWMLGILKYQERNLQVIEASKVLRISSIAGQNPSHVLVLSDSNWAISCDNLGDVVTIEYADIQWSQGNAISLGVIREKLACLLNSSGIINSLNENAK